MNEPTQKLPLARYLPVAIFLGFVVMMSTCFMLVFASRSLENVTREKARVSGLPADATNVNVFIPGLMGKDIYMDFKTSEEGYMEWVEAYTNTDLEKKSDSAFTIERYNFEAKQGQTITVEDGMLYAWTDGGKGVFLGFDRKSQRAFFHSKAN